MSTHYTYIYVQQKYDLFDPQATNNRSFGCLSRSVVRPLPYACKVAYTTIHIHVPGIGSNLFLDPCAIMMST